MEGWLEVELAVTEALAAEGVVPVEDARACRERAAFTVEAVEERERTTNHDVAAFVDVVQASIGAEGRWIHYGLTSSDVLDTALATQLVDAGTIVLTGALEYRDALIEQALRAPRHRRRRPHARDPRRALELRPAARRVRLRGQPQPRAAAARLRADRGRQALRCRRLLCVAAARGGEARHGGARARPRGLATQVVPRDRHAEVLSACALAAAGLERFATEVRNLQKTEVREVEEPFGKGQKGSSAMPHKRNPITTERITGLARVMRGYAQTGLENVALWHERDISHSGAERVILPDATICLDYMEHLGRRVAADMVVHDERMLENLELTYGAVYSQRVLTALLDTGMIRDDAYRIVQQNAQRAWDTRTPFRDLLESALAEQGIELDLDEVFDPSAYLRNAGEVFERLEALTG